MTVRSVDSLVFVANSAVDRWEENLHSYREMTQNLLTHHLDPANMPLVLQYNKRDLPEIMEIETMDRALNGRKVESIPAVPVSPSRSAPPFGKRSEVTPSMVGHM